MLVDTHTHIQLADFDGDRQEVLERAWAAGLDAIIVVGIDRDSSQQALELAGRHPRLYAAVGVHPHRAADLSGEMLDWLGQMALADRVVAVGEIGLDFYRRFTPPDVQLRVFREQLQMAAAAGLPVVVHSRAAEAETYDVLAWWAAGLPGRRQAKLPLGVMHCFAGDLELAHRYIELGFLISIPGPVTYPNAGRLADVAAAVPLAAMVVETDCPFLPPQSRRGRRNEPGYLPQTVARIAQLRGVAAEAVAEATTGNAARLFGLLVGQRASVPVRGEM